jgi:hypothetical protein
MTPRPENDPPLDHVVPLILLVLLFFASPFVYWWADRGGLWYAPYLLWLLVIALGSRIFNHRDRREL